MFGSPRVHEEFWPEVTHLGSNFARVLGRVETRDIVDGRLAGEEILPEEIFADPVRSDHAEPSDHYTSSVHRHLLKLR
jgi:hypothetical protein